MKILTVCSGLDFVNFTRRATIEAIHRLNPDMDILQYNSVLNIFRKKTRVSQIRFNNYHFWVVESLRKYRILKFIEHSLRYLKWRSFFSRYDIIFFIDPNQYYLLPYISKHQKLVYLLRDPSVLQDVRNYHKELLIIKRANIILGISRNLCSYYFQKYYGYIPEGVYLWPNTVDLNLWNYEKWKKYIKTKDRPLVGLAGNINYVTDIELLNHIAQKLPDIDFEFAGKLELDETEQKSFDHLILLPNVRYIGLIPFDQFPGIVVNWDIGLVAAKPGHEYARYLNNNKQYQYLALGKPFVTYNYNAEYQEFQDLVFIASDKEDYLDMIKAAIKKSGDSKCYEKGLNIAINHSSEKRAEQFLSIIQYA